MKCQKCHSKKDLNKSSVTSSGNQQYICRKCNRERMRAYFATDKGKIKANTATRKAYINHKEKWIARAKARLAITKGIIKKPKRCEVCEEIKPLQAHHEDYSKPLEVIFLCYSCHADADKLLESNNK